MPRQPIESQPMIGWPAERIAAVGAGALLVVGVGALLADMTETITELQAPDNFESVGKVAVLAGLSAMALGRRIAQHRGTAPDRFYD
jgi:hypothetical protein